jgi:hypothetical protein
MNKLYNGDIRYPNLNEITENNFYEQLEKIHNGKKQREIYLENLMKDFIQIPKKIPSLKEIEEKDFKEFTEELKREMENSSLNNEINNQENIEREKYSQDLYEEISADIVSSMSYNNQKNLDYIKQIREFSVELLAEKDKKRVLDEDIFGVATNLKIETNEKMMIFIGNYISRIKLKIE